MMFTIFNPFKSLFPQDSFYHFSNDIIVPYITDTPFDPQVIYWDYHLAANLPLYVNGFYYDTQFPTDELTGLEAVSATQDAAGIWHAQEQSFNFNTSAGNANSIQIHFSNLQSDFYYDMTSEAITYLTGYLSTGEFTVSNNFKVLFNTCDARQDENDIPWM